MNSRIRSRRIRAMLLAGSSTLVVLALSGCGHPEEETNPKPLVTVKIATVQQMNLERTVHAPAIIFPREQANIAARIAGPIRELKAHKGDTVAAGDVLAIIENRDLTAQVSEADNAVIDARNNLEKTSAGTLPLDIEHARGLVATTEASLNQARQIYEKRKRLFDLGAIPQRDLLVSETDQATAKTNYEVAVKSLDLLQHQSGDRDVKIAESKLKQAQARLENARAQLQFTELKSPFAGAVTEQLMYPGDMARPDAPVFTIMDLSVAIARAQIPETDAGEVRIGQPCSFTSADSPGTVFKGQISVVNRAVDPQRRTVEAWCRIPQSNLRAGVFGSAEVITGKEPNSLLVPQAAVQFVEGTKNGSVFVVDDKNTAHKKDIETGGIFDGKVLVKSGLNQGEKVIVEGGYGIPEGAAVQIAREGSK